MRHVITGSGVAGIAAIEAIRSVDRAADVTMVGDDPHGFYSRPGLAYYFNSRICCWRSIFVTCPLTYLKFILR